MIGRDLSHFKITAKLGEGGMDGTRERWRKRMGIEPTLAEHSLTEQRF